MSFSKNIFQKRQKLSKQVLESNCCKRKLVDFAKEEKGRRENWCHTKLTKG
jgi:hypothetical protein